MRKFSKYIFLLLIGVLTVSSTQGSRVAIRALPWHSELSNPANHSQFAFCRNHTDMGYDPADKNAFNAQFTFPEYYIPEPIGQVDTNPNTSPLIQAILTSGGPGGNNLYGLKICREILVGLPGGPFAGDSRILDPSDVVAIRQVITAAKNQGILVRDNFKMIQMVLFPNYFKNNPNAAHVIRMMDGVCLELHHFNVYWPLYSGRVPPSQVADGANWTLNTNNLSGQPLEYVLYFGPYKGFSCSDINPGMEDPFRTWLYAYWDAGLPVSNPRLIYDMNAFDHDCGSDRPALPESNPYSVTGSLKWLIGKVKGINPQGTTRYLRKQNAMSYAIDSDNIGSNPNNHLMQKTHMFQYMPFNINQQWHEISRGNNYFTYKRRGTNLVMDGDNGASNGQRIQLWSEMPGNSNQNWKKISVGGPFYRLEKQGTNHSIDGSGGAANFQHVKLWDTMQGNQNQHWFID